MRRKSKFKGVCHIKKSGMFKAQITKNGKSVYLGCFKSEVQAAEVYNFWAKKYHGHLAKLNDLEKTRL